MWNTVASPLLMSKSIRISERAYEGLVAKAKREHRTLRAVLDLLVEVAEVPGGGSLQQVSGGTASDGSTMVQSVSRSVHAGDAAEAPRPRAGKPPASERAGDGERVSEAGEVGAAAVRGVRGGTGGEASRRLREAVGGAVVVPDASSPNSEAPIRGEQAWWGQKCRRCGFGRRSHREGVGRCEAVPTCAQFREV